MYTGKYHRLSFLGRHILLIIPLVLFVTLKSTVDHNNAELNMSWYVRVFQFYIGSLSSMVAIIVALFSTSTLRRKNPRATLMTFAFVNMSALILVSSITTPGVVLNELFSGAFFWSLQLAFPIGAFFFCLTTIDWERYPKVARFITQTYVGLISLLLFVPYTFVVFLYPRSLRFLEAYNPLFSQLLGVIAILLFLYATYRFLFHPQPHTTRIDTKLPVIFILLAEAALFQAFGAIGTYSWLLHNPIVISALMLAIIAILSKLESSKHVQFSRYFAVLGSILMAATSLIFSELAPRYFPGIPRAALAGLVFAQSGVSFLVLFVVVHYLNRLIRERNEALEREQHLRTELTQLIVHDLKSPLSVITSGLNLMTKENLGSLTQTQKRLLNKLEDSGQQILLMINDLLDVERFEQGALNLQTSQINIVKLLQETADSFQIIASTNKQRLSFSSSAPLHTIKGDKRLLQRVFHNLLSNALKFTPENGRIDLTLTQENKHLVLRVADNGPGIPHHERERIFEKFAQIGKVERRGAGLGLTFCKMVVEAHKGFLFAEDSKLGGAQFCMGLPCPIEDGEVIYTSPKTSNKELMFKAN